MSAPVKVKMEADAAPNDLWQVAETDDSEQLEHLLAGGADVNASNAEGTTALMRAAYSGRVHMVRALIDHGADLNAARADGFTALMLAAFFGQADVVRVLIERGADPGRSTRFHTSAEMWATARAFYEVAQYLEQARSTPTREVEAKSSPLAENPGNEATPPRPVSVREAEPSNFEITNEPEPNTFADSSVSRDSEENSRTVKGRLPASSSVVRTLTDPPEIWDLVHENPSHFDPRSAFVERLTSSRANLVLLLLAVMFISGVATFSVWTRRVGRRSTGPAAQVQAEHKASPISADSQPQSVAPSATTEADVRQMPPQTTQQAEHETEPARNAPTDIVQPTGVSVNKVSRRSAPFAGSRAGALLDNRKGRIVSGRQTEIKSSPASGDREIAASAGTRTSLQTPQTTALKESEKIPSPPASSKRGSNPLLSPQLIAPPKVSPSKAKVIQWP